jgi:pimeloyl-ACP methyl ester carboxylesterase
MILTVIVGIGFIALALAVVTVIGTWAIERAHPPSGRFVDVAGGRLHVLELGPPDGGPVVLLHGASDNLQDMRIALGDKLAAHYRVILIDRPGHGWSDRPDGDADASPARQATLIAQALDGLGVPRAIVVAHSLAGAIALALALNHPERVGSLVLLAPVSHPWDTGIAQLYRLTTASVIGDLFARTIVLPVAYPFLDTFAAEVFAPQPLPPDYVRRSAASMVLRPSEFIANADDVAHLLEGVTAQYKRYGEITVPAVIIAGEGDASVSPKIHAQALAAQLPHAKLIMLPGVGHTVQHAAADLVVSEIDRLAQGIR